jgi:hypothetical protein
MVVFFVVVEVRDHVGMLLCCRYLVHESKETHAKMGELMDVFGDNFIEKLNMKDLHAVRSLYIQTQFAHQFVSLFRFILLPFVAATFI